MPSRAALAASLVPVVTALLVAVPSPAAADEQAFADPTGDTTHPADIVSVEVAHGDRIVVVVHHRNLTFNDAPARIRIAYDTGARYAGPEFYLRIAYQSDQRPELRTAKGWGAMHAAPVTTCHGERVRVRPGHDRTRISVPTSCFGDPHRVRVQVRVSLYADDARRADVAPAPHTMGPWVLR